MNGAFTSSSTPSPSKSAHWMWCDVSKRSTTSVRHVPFGSPPLRAIQLTPSLFAACIANSLWYATSGIPSPSMSAIA
jgi:hypothetical protein